MLTRYDELLTLNEREGYEPGYTHALLVPFLLHHSISNENLLRISENPPLTEGAEELVDWLKERNWHIMVMAASYEPYALAVSNKLAIPKDDTAYTRFPVQRYQRFWDFLGQSGLQRLAELEREILESSPPWDDSQTIKRLDLFYEEELPRHGLVMFLRAVKPLGGRRRLLALRSFLRRHGLTMDNIVFVGHGLADIQTMEAVNTGHGLAIAFDAGEHVSRSATVPFNSNNINDLRPFLEAWAKEGHRGSA